MKALGIDPGKTGGLAIVDYLDGKYNLISFIPMPLAGNDVAFGTIAEYLYDYAVDDCIIAGIEDVHAMPGQGVTSMFKFGFVTGGIHGILATLEIQTYKISPQKWKKSILDGTDKSKDAAIEWCNSIYPGVNLVPKGCKKAHSGMADAICIASYTVKNYLISTL